MAVIQNQQTLLAHLVVLENEEITEHNRKITSTIAMSGSDVELSRGVLKRYPQRNKRTFVLDFQYLPNTTDKTVDGRKGRDYLKTVTATKNTVSFKVKLDPNEDFRTYSCFINSYTETLIRRDIADACSYYNVSMELEEQ